ncbi:MFS general substrate transporter [Zopfia rhizophila CBS 207.26]|uniref:MFS general substrate transporter n=1 Tax=Zopfia rhizophila CBS 207.26 TaxID=1314779 RepID=A0A6A6EFN2_9PEZI|nr:MFS general substrate transporter [Zopfia rhizophila CBS 207.26]
MPWQLHSIDNPLARTSLERLDQEAREFARHVTLPGLDDELFVEAARIARDYRNWDTVKCLTDQEKEALRQERLLGFWRQPKTRLIMIAITCIAAIVQGWTQTGGSVANQSWPAEFGLTDLGAGDIAKDKPTWIFAYVNAATRLGGSLFGCWLSARLQSRISGCRGAILISACLCMASTISASFAHSWQQLFWCGVMLGSGIGIVASVARIYGAEVSPSHLRGALEMNWPLFDALGTLLGFTASLIVSKIGPLSWRFQMASGSLPAICLLTLIYIVPEPPHRLLEQGRLPEAFAALLALRQTRLQAAIELFYINAQIQTEIDMLSQKSSDTGEAGELVQHAWRRAAVDNTGFYQCQSHVKSTNYLIRFGQLIRDKRMRRAIVASLVVMMSQQLCGINILSFYSSILFRDGNRDTIDAVWLRWGISLANFLFALHAGNFMDIRGWRFLLLTAYLGMQPLIFAACLSPSISMWSRAGIPVSSFFIFVFTFFYSECPGPVTVAYSSRIFPLLNREACMSLAVSISMFVAGLLTLFVPQLTQNLAYGHDNYEAGQYSLLAILISFKILGLLPLFFSITETAHFSLETLIYIFNVPMFQLIPYKLWHALQWVPSILGWTVSHYILRKEVEKPRD